MFERGIAKSREALRNTQQKLKCQVACLPIGHCLGDGESLRRIAAALPAGVRVVDPNTIEGIMDVIAAGDAFCGTSLHGTVTAFSWGVPLAIGMIQYPKIPGL